MAAALGFQIDHYDVSIKAGERVLLPAVRDADKDTLIIANGFSCREQIAQTTDRQALHLAQVIQMAMHESQGGAEEDYPEAAYTKSPYPLQARLRTSALIGTAILLAGGAGAWIGKLVNNWRNEER